jgi:hypothetical protein
MKNKKATKTTEGHMNQQQAVVAMAKEIAENSELRAREMFQTFDTDVLLAIAKGEISAVDVAKHELASRGLGAQGTWIGFDRARAFWPAAHWMTNDRGERTLVTIPQE